MANGDEAAIAALEAELGLGPATEEGLAQEEAQVTEDARIQAAIEQDRATRQHPFSEFMFGTPEHQAAMEAERKLKSETSFMDQLLRSSDYNRGRRERLAAERGETEAPPEPAADPGVETGAGWKAELDPEKLAKEKSTEEDYLSGINRQIWMQGQIGKKLGQIGDKQAELIGLKADYGAGFPETLADAKLRIQQKYVKDTQAYQARFDTNMEEAELMAQYPGASMDQIRLWKRQMEFDPHRVGFSPEAAKDMLRRKATAMKNLARAEEIDPNRAFGGVTSQILAGLAIGLGAWASSKSGRPNTALDLYKHAISTDILAQKEKFSHARGAPARERSQYAFWMNRYDNERVATLGTAVAQYGAAANTIQKEIAQLKGGVQKDQALAIQGQLMSQKNKLQMELAKAAMEAERAQNSEVNDLDGKPIRYTGPAKYNVKIRNDLAETGRKSHQATGALEQYRQAWKEVGLSAMKPTDKRAKLDAALQALIARLGDVWDKGVLQEFEWEQLNDMLPGSSWPVFERFGPDRVEAVLDELQKSFAGALNAHVDSLSNYQRQTGGFKGDVVSTGEQGAAAQQGVLNDKQKAALARFRKKKFITDSSNWKTRKEREKQ
tara:strand:- start:8190 stop:10016 length:1827 start_codon:yes stop_codon:yes gene_type:complete